MTFSEKIRKIVRFNKLGITSPSALEKYIDAGQGSITTPMRNGEESGEPTLKKIFDVLRINMKWWETGEGDIFIVDEKQEKEGAPKESSNKAFEKEAITWELWQQLKKNNEKFEQQIDKLWNQIEEKDRLINRLTPGNSIKRITTKNR